MNAWTFNKKVCFRALHSHLKVTLTGISVIRDFKRIQDSYSLRITISEASSNDSYDSEESRSSEKFRSYLSLCSNFSNGVLKEGKIPVDVENNVISLLLEKRMVCYSFVHVFFELAYHIPIVFLPETMITDRGISNSFAGTIISIIGVSNMIGKLLTGSILQCFEICPILFSAITLMLLCISCTAMTLCVLYEHFVIVGALYGLVLSSIVVCSPFIVMKIMDEDKLKDGFGLIMIAKMFCPLWGLPIGGALKDWFGTYRAAFYAASVFLFLSHSFNFLVFLFSINHNRYTRIQ